jgi:hypothetical protein
LERFYRGCAARSAPQPHSGFNKSGTFIVRDHLKTNKTNFSFDLEFLIDFGNVIDLWKWEIIVKVTEERKLNGINRSRLIT